MVNQLLLCKRLFIEGESFVKRDDSISSGMAISLFQDAVELYLWTLIKERSIPLKDTAGFTEFFGVLKQAGINITLSAKLNELNKARVNFKHYGNLPASEEALKFNAYVEEFLLTSFKEHFQQDFKNLSLIDLVSFIDVKTRLQNATFLTSSEKFIDAASELAIAKALLFSHLDKFIPEVSSNLRASDPSFEATFVYIANYLDTLREAALASFLQIPLERHYQIKSRLPNAFKTISGTWHTIGAHKVDAEFCSAAVDYLVDVALRLERLK